MKRPNAKEIRAELERRRLHDAQAMARSDAIADARIAKAVDVFAGGRDRDLADFEATLPGLVSCASRDRRSGRSRSTR